MKAVLHLLWALVLLTTVAHAQNVFNPADPVYTYNAGSAAGSNTNPNTPPANTIAKWVRTVNRINWDATKFKCYYFNGMAFRLRFPNNYNPAGGTKYPVLVFYHGGGETGPVTDNEDQLYWGAQLFEQRINAGKWNGFLLFPQQTNIGWDDSYFSRVNNILDTLQRYNNLDPDGTIAMGLSSGGYGAIAYAQLYPQRVASCVSSSPESVNTLSNNIANAVHIPLWIANGGQDSGPDPYGAAAFIGSFRSAGGNCYQTYLADEGHITWSLQWALANSSGNELLSTWWNNAHKAQPLVFYSNDHFCTGGVNARLGISAGYAAYEWQYDNGGGFTTIGGAASNEYQATQAGTYRVRFQRDAASGWSAWTPHPVLLTEKACSADTLFAEHFEGANPFYYASASYKPYTFGCQNGVFTASTYNITQDGSGKTGGQFLLHNTSANGCTYTTADEVWHAPNVIGVIPNTNYEYVFYLANRSTSSNAKIMPTINGVPVAGSAVQAPGSGSWTRFRFVWNSGNNTYADIALQNQTSATSGNDFAIDDISFGVPAPNQPPPPPTCGALPSGVSTTDIGGGLLGLGGIATGSACFAAPDTYDIKGAGDLTALSDKFRFVYRSFSGNGTMMVKVVAQDAVSSLNKAGLMFRESLSSGANYAFLGLTSGNGVYLQSQTLLGLSVSTTSTGAGVIKAPYYLRLVRNGTSFTGSVSVDGINWTTVGSKTVSMSASTIYIGLAVCSHSNNTLSEALFSNWTILNSSGQQVNAARTVAENISNGVPAPGNSDLKVYPNPAPAGFVADFSVNKKQTVWLTITSGADGRTCHTETLHDFSGHYHQDLGWLHLPKGSYAVTVRTETGIKTIILVKQ